MCRFMRQARACLIRRFDTMMSATLQVPRQVPLDALRRKVPRGRRIGSYYRMLPCLHSPLVAEPCQGPPRLVSVMPNADDGVLDNEPLPSEVEQVVSPGKRFRVTGYIDVVLSGFALLLLLCGVFFPARRPANDA